ncbi:MAG: hypothetical protein LBL59_09710 [Xanthomonadaceae bacterium]|jgi:hypothetical protein|nr:hypothetical protein [Xanthomonadaceae bacterium]
MQNKFHKHHALVFSLLVALGAGTVPGSGLAQQVATESASRSLSGEITSRSPLNANDGSRYQRFTVNLQANTAVRFTLNGALDGSFTLQDSNGMVLGSSFNSSNSNILVQEISTGGRYTLNVSGKNRDSFGPFWVDIVNLDVRNSGAVSVDSEITGSLSSSSSFNAYTFNVTEEGRYQIDLMSDDFDAKLKLTGQGVDLEDDDGGEERNSRITMFLQPGTYQVRASGYSNSSQGMYTLKIISRPLPPGVSFQNGGTLTPGTEITGLYSGGSAQTYTLNVPRRSLAVIDMKSDDFDSYLELRGNGVNITDDDGGDSLNAKIVTPLDPGAYTIHARSFNNESGGGGIFTLKAELGSGVMPAGSRTIQPGFALAGQVPSSGRDTIELRVTRAADYTIDLIAPGFDAYLELQGEGVNESNDDGGNSLNARISRYLEPGRYRLTSRAYNSEDHGGYTLIVSEPGGRND